LCSLETAGQFDSEMIPQCEDGMQSDGDSEPMTDLDYQDGEQP